MAPAKKPAYVKPLKELVASSSRVQEQLKGRLLDFKIESLHGGKEKGLAIMVDKDQSLQGVLVLEAWSPADRQHMQKTLQNNVGKVVSVTNSRIQSRGKTLAYFDANVKMAFDTQTQVALCADDNEYPTELPALPDIKHATCLSTSCVISVVAVVVEGGQAVDRSMSDGKMKPVCNLKVATGSNEMTAAFWDHLAEKMGKATSGQVYRLDWMVLKLEGGGKYQLSSISGTKTTLIEGSKAKAVSDNLADPASMQTMSATFGKTREDKMNEATSPGSLTTVEAIETLKLTKPGVLLVPAAYVLDARGMSSDSPSRAWYLGCSKCKKQLDTNGPQLECPDHGHNQGKKVYAAQLLFADPGHKKELAIWEEGLKAMANEHTPSSSLDDDTFLEQLLEAVTGKGLCLRIGIGARKNGLPMIDLFDVTSQVDENGCLALYKNLEDHSCARTPGLAPVCCKTAVMNELGQLTVQHGGASQTVERVKMVAQLTAKPQVEVLQDIDGIKVTLTCKCVACDGELEIAAAGVPGSVQDVMSMPKGAIFAAFATTKNPEGEFKLANHVQLDGPQKNMDIKVFKYEVGQFQETITTMNQKLSDSSEDIGAKRTLEVEKLMAAARETPKRLKIQHTTDGNKC